MCPKFDKLYIAVAKRIFTTKALKQQTRNRYNRLPEIVFKEEIERQNRIKRSNRIVRDMFNKVKATIMCYTRDGNDTYCSNNVTYIVATNP